MKTSYVPSFQPAMILSAEGAHVVGHRFAIGRVTTVPSFMPHQASSDFQVPSSIALAREM